MTEPAHRFAFVHELNLLIHDYGEAVEDLSLRDHLLRVYDHADFRPDMDVLCCFDRTHRFGVTPEGLRRLADLLGRRLGSSPPESFVAVVISASQVGYGLARLYGAHADRDGAVTAEILDSVSEACEWLDRARGRPAGTVAAVAGAVLARGGCCRG